MTKPPAYDDEANANVSPEGEPAGAGLGGLGGAGRGGRGGPSVGLAFLGTEPAIDEADITIEVTEALGGPGGNGNTQGNGGALGLLAKKQSFE